MKNIDLVTVGDKAHAISNSAIVAFWNDPDHTKIVEHDDFHIQRIIRELQAIAGMMGFALVKLDETK